MKVAALSVWKVSCDQWIAEVRDFTPVESFDMVSVLGTFLMPHFFLTINSPISAVSTEKDQLTFLEATSCRLRISHGRVEEKQISGERQNTKVKETSA